MESKTQTNVITLLPCPFCGNEPERQHFNISPHLPGRIICSCGAEMRQGRNQTSAELVGAWNARTCGEEGAIIATEEAMAEHGWVRERTCHDQFCGKAWCFKCDICGCTMPWKDSFNTRSIRTGLLHYCPSCGAKVVEHG